MHDHTSVSYTENTKRNRDTVSEYFALGADIIAWKKYYSTINTPVYYKLPKKINDLRRKKAIEQIDNEIKSCRVYFKNKLKTYFGYTTKRRHKWKQLKSYFLVF